MFNKQITKIIKICLQNYSMRFDPILTKRFLCLCFVWKCKNGNKKRWIISMFCYADTHTRAYTCACKRYVWIPIIQLFNWIMYLKVFIHWFLIILKESIKFGHIFLCVDKLKESCWVVSIWNIVNQMSGKFEWQMSYWINIKLKNELWLHQ